MIVSRILKNCYSIPVKKARDLSNKAEHRPVSLRSVLSKVFERLIFDQFSIPTIFLTKFYLVFGRPHCTWYALFRLLQSWQKELDSCGYVGTIFMDLFESLYCITHDLLIAKLEPWIKLVLKSGSHLTNFFYYYLLQ